jgi:kynurenine formamidase
MVPPRQDELTTGHAESWTINPIILEGAPRAYDLGQPMAPGMPHLPSHPPFSFSLTKLHGEVIMGDGVSGSGDVFTSGGHVGTHIDALGHISQHGQLFGDRAVAERHSYTDGMQIGSIDEIQPIIAPGLLVDMPLQLGRDLTAADVVTANDLDLWFRDRPKPERGSVVLIRTGWARYWTDNARYLGFDEGCPGVDLSGATWLTNAGVRATGADTIAFEKWPTPDIPIHVHLLVRHGVPIIEALNLEALARDRVYDFLLVAIPLRIKGGTGSPVRPIAISKGASSHVN